MYIYYCIGLHSIVNWKVQQQHQGYDDNSDFKSSMSTYGERCRSAFSKKKPRKLMLYKITETFKDI